jgi:glycosyltransferase involved in cell wall biosynthesis
MQGKTRNIGFVSTRLAGTDGVSLETEKWASVFREEGYECFYLAGQLDRDPSHSHLVPEADFRHPAVFDTYQACFSRDTRREKDTAQLHKVRFSLKKALYRFLDTFKINLLVVENALAIPLNIPLGLALTEVIAETGIPTIAHHHDFFWERQRFLSNSVWDYLGMAFPPSLPQVHHVVINTSAEHQLGLRSGMSSTVIPNVMDFERPPPPIDDFAKDVRRALGVSKDELFVLQPTRVVQRKGIEHAIELVKRLDTKARLIISHASGDEGYDYEKRLMAYADMLGVNTLFVSEIIGGRRGRTKSGAKIYALQDVYPHADLVTYPSSFEGFGNAFLEAIYFRKPLLINTYSIYQIDIKPKGFEVIEMDGYITNATVERAREVLADGKLRERMVNHNYVLGCRHYSYSVLQEKLRTLLAEHGSC